jgi:peptide/nickel transport system substrate-binding protein
MKKAIIFSLVTVSTLFFLAGVQGGEAQAKEGNIEELVIGVQGDISNQDVQVSRGTVGQAMHQLSYNGLCELDKDGNIIPGLAERWEISDDGLEYIFYLRKGVRFHNGREFKAGDVEFTFKRYAMPEVGFPFQADFNIMKKFDIIDDYTIKLTLDRPYAPLLAGVVSGQRGIVAKEGYTNEKVPKFVKQIGTGPYKVVGWDPDNYYKLEAFEDYWAGAPKVKKITFKIVPDETVRITALKTGDVDMILAPPSLDLIMAQRQQASDYKLEIIPKSEFLVWGLAMDQSEPPFNDVRVRQAFYHAIDPQAIIDTVYKGVGAEITNDFYPKGTPWDIGIERPRYDPGKAKALLEEAGYGNGLEVLMFAAVTHALDKQSEVIQAQLAKVGVTAKIEVIEWTAWLQAGRDWNPYNCAIHGTNLWVDPAKIFSHVFSSKGRANWWTGWYNTPETDQWLRKAEIVTDMTERKELYRMVLEKIRDDAGFIWTHIVSNSYGYRSELQGIRFNFRGDFIYENNKGLGWITKTK